MWLDFSEIPPAKAPSQDTEAFEKFAKQFFEDIYSGKIIKTAGRGADGRVDIIVEVDGKKWLVTCKHYLKGSVTASTEEDPRGRLDSHGCTKFVGFYSGSPNNSLNNFLDSIRRNHPSFDFEIFNNQDIESRLFSFSNVTGWLLAARWFPKSYAKIFSQLVHPLSPFSEKDIEVHSSGNKLKADNSPISFMFAPGNASSEARAKEIAIFSANEIATSKAFAGIFLNRIAEFANLFPNSFQKICHIQDEKLSHSSIFPTWDFRILRGLILEHNNLKGAYAICRVWSLWDPRTALEHMRATRILLAMPRNISTSAVSTNDVMALYDELNGINASKSAFLELNVKLTLSDIATDCSTLERGYFAGLLCFSPTGLHQGPDKNWIAVHLAKQYGETEILNSRLWEATSKMAQDDQQYVTNKSRTLFELLESVQNIDCIDKNYSDEIEANLRCFNDNGMEPWMPDAIMSSELANILKPRLS